MLSLRPRRTVMVGCLFELALLGFAGLGDYFTGRQFWERFYGMPYDAAVGVLATLPLLVAGWLACDFPWAPLARMRAVVDTAVQGWFAGCSWRSLAAISLLAGVAEEALFRGFLQGGLTNLLGIGPAWVLASVVFGLCHALTPAYAIVAGLMGAYLGGLWLHTGTLLAPALTHALYDFAALLWLLRAGARRS